MVWLSNPRHQVPEDCHRMVDLFLRGLDVEAFGAGASGLSAMKFLPDEGGINDQACTIDTAFLIIGQVVRGLQKRDMAT